MSITTKQIIDDCAAQVPMNWLDPMLTGKEAVIGKPPYSCEDIEILLREVKKRISTLEL